MVIKCVAGEKMELEEGQQVDIENGSCEASYCATYGFRLERAKSRCAFLTGWLG